MLSLFHGCGCVVVIALVTDYSDTFVVIRVRTGSGKSWKVLKL